MPYSFDETNPLDASLVSAFPSNERAQRTQVKGWATKEHSLTGRHLIPNGNGTGSRPATDLEDGVLYLDRGNGTTGDGILDRYNGSSWLDFAFVPTGGILALAYSPVSPPRGFLACNGNAVSRTTYARLFARISTAFDLQNGASAPAGTDFRVPNLGSAIPIGFQSGGDADGDHGTIGGYGGNKKLTIAQANLPNVNFTVTEPNAGAGHHHAGVRTDLIIGDDDSSGGAVRFEGGNDFNAIDFESLLAPTGITVSSGGSGTLLDARPKFVVLGWVIKT